MTISEKIKQEALRLGFDACGISAAVSTGEGERYRQWLSERCHGTMEYMARNVEKRIDPRLLVEGAKSIISVALNYYPPIKLPGRVPQFAYYAYGKDYHDVMRGKLHLLFEWIKECVPSVKGRYFSDSAPVLERFWAARAGLGFIGKNTLLIIPGKGSYFFLGELIVDVELDYDQPILGSCEGCSRCLKACPTGALGEPYRLNAGKCISYLTIEHRGTIPRSVSPNCEIISWLDICQKACPITVMRFPILHLSLSLLKLSFHLI